MHLSRLVRDGVKEALKSELLAQPHSGGYREVVEGKGAGDEWRQNADNHLLGGSHEVDETNTMKHEGLFRWHLSVDFLQRVDCHQVPLGLDW